MAAVCEAHVVGSIANKEVTAADWNDAIRAFVRKVDDFNVRGQRDEIPHPGIVIECRFCPLCGSTIGFSELALLTYDQAFEELRPLDAAMKGEGV